MSLHSNITLRQSCFSYILIISRGQFKPLTNAIRTCVHVLYCGMCLRMNLHHWLTQDCILWMLLFYQSVYAKWVWLIIVPLIGLRTHLWERPWVCFQRALTEVGRPTLSVTGGTMDWSPRLNQKGKCKLNIISWFLDCGHSMTTHTKCLLLWLNTWTQHDEM